MALIVFAITLFVSAFMLFLVQPMIGKMILPKLGGTPQVWNTCMLFFQTVLLAGYFYTHSATTFLKPRMQMILHGVLLFLPLIVMLAMGRPFDVTSWVPPSGSNPIFAALLLLLTIVGLPFFVVSTSAPLLQKWFSFSGDPTAHDPYFLYGASNFGSLLSLAAYPFFVEPWFDVPTQTWIWFAGYVALMGLFFASAAIVWQRAEVVPPIPESPASIAPDPLPAQAPPTATPSTAIQPSRMVGKKKGLKGAATVPSAAAHMPSVARKPDYDPQTAPVTVRRCIRWALLAAVPSSLMLGVTSYVSTDLSPFPLVWAIPLSLYLLTFILVFARWPVIWTKEPHTMALFCSFVAVALFCFGLFTRNYSPTALSTVLAFFAIFVITLALHGELAKDRPAPRSLTLFFLLMSFGGMLGGLFNALIAPVVFTSVVEYPLAVIIGCFLLPNMADRGFTDGKLLDWMPDFDKSLTETSDTFAQSFGRKPEGKPFLFNYFWDILIGVIISLIAWYTTSHATEMGQRFIGLLGFLGGNEANLLDNFQHRGPVFLFAVYGIPIIMCLFVLARSMRFAVGIAGLLFFGYFVSDRDRNLLYAGRSYFGVLRVAKDSETVLDKTGRPAYTEIEDLPEKDREFQVNYNFLMHGSTYHGRNYQMDQLSRLATTYYHRFGPVGAVMEKYNWLPYRQNTYYGDLRMPATIIGLAAAGGGICSLPLEQFTNAWTEPPFATVGLGTGTMASYVRPFGHLAYYEIDDKIRAMSLPPDGREPYFRYVKEAGERGANVEIIMGDARLSLEREKEREEERLAKKEPGPTAMRNGYYKVIVLDAFSSDAIPVHLITKRAVEVYMEKLAPDGILCVHTSNRHLVLVDPVADIAQDLKLDWLRAHDNGGDREGRLQRQGNRVFSLGHFSSEYIMLARKGVMDKNKLKTAIRGYPANQSTTICEWAKNPAPNKPIWTDNYQNIMSILR